MRPRLRRHAAAVLTCLLLLVWFIPNAAMAANTLSRYDVDVALDAQGNGTITETRTMDLSEGTENYIVIGNLQGAEISDFAVSENGQPFTNIGDWNVKASREEKTGKCGIVRKGDGYELCWGMGEYGPHTYTVTYKITGLVRQLTDGQALNWQFWNPGTNTPPEAVNLSIRGPQPFSKENTKIWGFGFSGTIAFDNGRIVATSSGPLSQSNYVTVLAQFLNTPFQPTLKQDSTLADQETKAKEGSSYGQGKTSSEAGDTSTLGKYLRAFSTVLFSFLALIGFVFSRRARKGGGRGKIFDVPYATIKNRNKGRYHRDVPYPGPITHVQRFLEHMHYGRLEDYFNAYLLKWLQEGRVRQASAQTGLIFKKDSPVIEIMPAVDLPFDDELEERFFNMLIKAAGDNILEANEFSRWAKNHSEYIEKWKNDLEARSTDRLVKEGYVRIVDQGYFLASVLFTKPDALTPEGNDLMDHIVGYHNYLKDFSLLEERNAPEVALWKQLFIWAALYGIAEEVAKTFKDLYPQYTPENGGVDIGDVMLMSAFSHNFTNSYYSAQTFNADSGGGGFTSMGGGGGSFGGGFGGGTR